MVLWLEGEESPVNRIYLFYLFFLLVLLPYDIETNLK